jgi:hypothetical protein
MTRAKAGALRRIILRKQAFHVLATMQDYNISGMVVASRGAGAAPLMEGVS